jgi:ADP-heptose:LPS heptosyltransferase
MNEFCECETDGFCKKYNRQMIGRLRDICQGTAVDAGTAAQYRALWAVQASDQPTKNGAAKINECPYRGEAVKDAGGDTVKRECGACGGAKRQVFHCNHPSREPDEITLADCVTCDYRPRDTSKARKLILRNGLCPGDVLVMSGAIHSLHRACPGQFVTAVETSCNAIYEHNPDVAELFPLMDEPQSMGRAKEKGYEYIQTHYPAVQQSNQRGIHFLQAYCEFLENCLGAKIPLLTNRPMIYVSKREKGWINQVHEKTGKNRPFWLINAGYKNDYSAKWYPWYQQIVDQLQGKILFAQIGKNEPNHIHAPLKGTVNLIGETDDRQLIRLVYHSAGVVSGLTYLMHLAAAFRKPSVVIAGGREPKQWNQYPTQHLVSTVGMLPCAREQACWRSRVVPLNDGKDETLCENPVLTEPSSPKCMAMIKPEEISEKILQYQT